MIKKIILALMVGVMPLSACVPDMTGSQDQEVVTEKLTAYTVKGKKGSMLALQLHKRFFATEYVLLFWNGMEKGYYKTSDKVHLIYRGGTIPLVIHEVDEIGRSIRQWVYHVNHKTWKGKKRGGRR